MKYTKDTFSIGFGFLFACGLLGLISLIIESFKMTAIFENLTLSQVIGPLLVGTFQALAIVLSNIAAGLGIAGVSNSIIHVSIVCVTIFNFVVFS